MSTFFIFYPYIFNILHTKTNVKLTKYDNCATFSCQKESNYAVKISILNVQKNNVPFRVRCLYYSAYALIRILPLPVMLLRFGAFIVL
jgi:hypothetical protein